MYKNPTAQEITELQKIWKNQAAVEADPIDFVKNLLPCPKKALNTDNEPYETLSGLLMKLHPWADWVRFYKKPILALKAASLIAKDRTRAAGIYWMAPGAGAPFDPPSGEPGLAVLKADWAGDADSMLKAQSEAGGKGLLVMVDDTVTAFRLHKAGASGYFGLEPDLLLLGPSLAGGQDLAVLLGNKEPPEEPKRRADAKAVSLAACAVKTALDTDSASQGLELGRLFLIGLDFFRRQAGLLNEIKWQGPLQMPRLSGTRIWAFFELAKEEGLFLSPLALPDLSLSPKDMTEKVWPRLARASARLKALPEGKKAPLGWKDALLRSSCSKAEEMVKLMAEEADRK